MDDRLDRAPCGFLSFTDDGRIVDVNTTLVEALGYERSELVGRHVEATMGVGSRIFFQTHLFPLVAMHGRAEEIFLLLRGKQGGDVPMLLNAVRRERDGVQLTDCVLVRVRERQKYESELLAARRSAEEALAKLAERQRALETANTELAVQQERLQEQATELEMAGEELRVTNDELLLRTEQLELARGEAEHANRAKSEFLARMSHELRTPLNAIGGYADLVTMGVHGPVSDAQREALGRIVRSQRHLLRLINDILNLAKIEAGRVDYRIEPVALATVVSATMQMVQPQITSKGLRCDASVPPDAVALADREKLEQIVLNLLTNAVKFTPAGGRVTIDVARRDGAPGLVFLRVEDTGIGIAESKLPGLFEPFVQVRDAQTPGVEGTGLGLAISRDLARGMHGDLRVRSRPGVGSTFTVSLPAAGTATSESPPTREETSHE